MLKYLNLTVKKSQKQQKEKYVHALATPVIGVLRRAALHLE